MLIHLSEHSNDTLQEQIRDQIRRRILSGDLSADHALPSIRGLASSLKVSVITVQRAYESLLNDGLVYARRGKGYFVAPLEEGDKTAMATKRFGKQLRKLIRGALQDGLTEAQVRQEFAAALKAGEQDGTD